MKFLRTIVDFFWRASLRFRSVQPGKIFVVAQRDFLLLRLFFVDRQRQLENVACDVLYISPQKILLKSNKRFLPDILKGERCSLYVKIPHAVAEKYLGISYPAIRHGFIFKTRIIANYIDTESKQCLVEVSMPKTYVQRDLQRHERVGLTPLMLKKISLWICNKQLPKSVNDMDETHSGFVGDNICSAVKVVNMSAGGLRVQIDGLKGFENPRSELNKPVVVHLVLYKTSRKELSVWAVCSCVKVHFSPSLKILTFFLKYVREWDDPDEGGVGWKAVDRDGISDIESWVDNDYCMLLDKNHMISEELCRCFGLDPVSMHKKSRTPFVSGMRDKLK